MGYRLIRTNNNIFETNLNGNFILPIISIGTGTGVSTLKLTVSENTQMFISGAGRFYTDSAGTLGESTYVNIAAGAIRTFYLKVTSGQANITVLKGNTVVTRFDDWISSTNAASIYNYNISGLPISLTYFICRGNNTITGNIADLKSALTYFLCTGNNTITGNIADLKSALTFFLCAGSNTITGNIADLKSALTTFCCSGNNTITGNIADLKSALTFFLCAGSNTITGNIGLTHANMTSLYILGNNTIQQYTSKTWKENSMSSVHIRSNTGTNLSAADNDQLLIDLNNSGNWTGDKVVNLKGSRTSASDAAVAALQGKGVTVTVN